MPPREYTGSVMMSSAAAPMRILPHDVESEQAVLGALLIDSDAIAVVRDLLEPGDFYAEKHGHIYRAAVALSDRGEPIDVLTLKVQLDRERLLERSGGLDYIAELSLKVPTSASIKHYAEIVIDHSLRRRLITAGAELAELGFAGGTQATEEILDTAEQRVFAIADSRRGLEVSHIAPLLTETWELLERRAQSKQIVHGVPTNFSKLDSITQGLQPGELIILAARPSVGKTSFALNITRNAAVLAKRAVAVFSLEMSKQSLVQRLICSEAMVDAYLLSTGQADSTAFHRIADAMDRLSQANIWIDDSPSLSISNLRARARRMRSQQQIDLVVVDYLQLMRGGRHDSRVQEVSEISSGLKSIAKELHIPVLALSQLSRESERRENRKPQLSDLRDSGCLTGDSRVWMADEQAYVPIRNLVGQSNREVLGLNPRNWLLQRARIGRAFHSGVKPVYRLRLRSGRTIRASGNHQFLTLQGWRRLDVLFVGSHLAIPRWLPAGAGGGVPGPGVGVRSGVTGRHNYPRSRVGYSHRTLETGAPGQAPVATALATADPAGLVAGDVQWDVVETIEAAGFEDVFDLTIPDLANFVAESIVVHNSIEQDADVVLFLYRPGMHKEDIDRSVTELLVEKNRNGPTAKIDLTFIANQTSFREPALND